MELYFSSGQMAEDLETSPETIRRLCQAGAIKAELSQGGQYRIPQSERDRLLRDGLPSLPRPLPGDKGRPTLARNGTPPPGLLAQPSDSLVESAEGVAKLAYEVKTLRLQRRRDAEVDHIRKRESRIEQEQREQVEAAQARQAAQVAERERAEWLRRWEQYAISRLYWSESELKLEVHAAVRTALSGLDPIPSGATCQALVEAIIETARNMAKCKRQSQETVELVMKSLPYAIRCVPAFAIVKGEMLTQATNAVNLLPLDTGIELKEAAARRAIAPMLQTYEYYQVRQAMVDGLPGLMPRANQEEKETARRSLTSAFEDLPVGTSQTKLEEVRDRVRAGAMELVDQRLESERRQAEEKERQREAARRRSEAESTVRTAISHVDDELKALEQAGEVEFDGFNDRWETTVKMKERVSPLLLEQLLKQPEMTREQVKRRFRALVRKNLPAVVPD